jgi:hypothetical protein
VGDFTTLLLDINPTLASGGYPEVWTQYTVTISGVAAPTQGRFAFRYYVNDGGPAGNNSNYIGVDLFEYTASAGQQASIELTKTVGTVAGVCATTDTITVATGTDVYYCYQVENTGDVTFNFHDLVDDQLGTLLTDLPYVLAPGAFSPEVIISETVAAPVVNTATWTAVDALGGYAIDDTIAYNFEDISATGTAVTLTDDSTAPFPIGFSFDFYGTTYTDFYVSSNGFLATTGTSNGCCTGQNLPNVLTPNGVIAGWWEDMNPSGGGTHHYQVLGSAPNRRLIFQVTNVPHYSSGNPVTLQYKLYEGTNAIEVHYQAAPSDGGTHTAGIENQDGTVAAQYYNGAAALTTPLAIRYAPTVEQSASDTDAATVNISDPDINVTPASMVSSLLVGTTETQVLNIGNTGTAVLDWTIDEAGAPTRPVGPFPPILEPAGPGDMSVAEERVGDVPVGKTPTWYPERGPWSGPDAVIYDNGPLVTHPGQGAGGADASALQDVSLGMGTYGFGAQLSAGNRVADDFVVSYAGGWQIDTITFFAYQTGSGTTSSINALNLQIWNGPPNAGGTVIWGNTTTNIMTSTTWSNDYRVLEGTLTNTDRPIMAVVGTVGTVLPPGTYWLDWQFGGSASFSGPWQPPVTILGQTTTGNALQYTSTGWANLVDVGPQGLPFIIDGAASQCMMPEDIPWLSVSPTAGTTAAGGTTPVDVTFDATAVGVGTYNALLCVLSNDPDEPLVEVPVTMDVVIPVELMEISIE